MNRKYLNPSLIFKSKDEEDKFRSKYEVTQIRTTELLKDKAEVYCLQEVFSEDIPLIKSLKERNFEIIYLKGLPYMTMLLL